MIHKQTTNTFSEGLIMDLNPVTTPNNVLTNALNATYITYNGNEYALQNDMGNGRVETAYLPQGFIPLGTTSFGGIIYIVSYNPLIDRCLVGCFPSPERNISKYNNVQSTQEIGLSYFIDNNNVVTTTTLKFPISDISLSPGDKFLIYGSGITDNSKILSDYGTKKSLGSEPKCISIRLATIDSNGKIAYIDSDLNWIKYAGTDPKYDKYYYIQENKSSAYDNDLESERKKDSSLYNIFNSKVPGNIYVIATLETIDTFDVTYNIVSTVVSSAESVNTILYSPEFTMNTTASNNKILSGVLESSGIELSLPSPLSNQFTVTCNNKYTKEDGIKSFTFIPQMTCHDTTAKLNYLSKTINIDFSLVGSNTTDLYLWRYYNNDSYLTLNWGILTYYEPATVDYIEFKFDNLVDSSKSYTYKINDYVSYNGSFTRNFNYNDNLIKDSVYLVTINIYVKNTLVKSLYKILYTATVFNTVYIQDSSVKDFGTLQLNKYLDLNLEFDVEYVNEVTTSLSYPNVTTAQSWADDSSDTLGSDTLGLTSYNFNNKDKQNSKLTYGLLFKNNYNLFTLNNLTISYTLEKSSSANFTTPTSAVNGALEPKDLLKLILNNLEFLTYDVIDNSSSTLKNKTQTLPFDIYGTYSNPIWASMKQSGVTYTNLIAPLIYNDSTAALYDLTTTKSTDDSKKCKIDTNKILCIGGNARHNDDWWIAYGEFSDNNKLILKERLGGSDTSTLTLGSSLFYDSIITTYALANFNNSPVIPYCFIQTYNNADTYKIYNIAALVPKDVGFEGCLQYIDGENTALDVGKLYYGILIKNSSGYYVPIRMITVGNSKDSYINTDANDTEYKVLVEADHTVMTTTSVNRKVYETLCQLYKVYSNVNYTVSDIYTYDLRSYFNSFNLESTKNIEITPSNISKVYPFNLHKDASLDDTVNPDINNNLKLSKTFDKSTIQLKFTTPIKQNLLEYYLQDLSYQSYIIRTNENKYYVPSGSSYSTNNLYFIEKSNGQFSNNLILLNLDTYSLFTSNFRKLLSINYDTAGEHTCTFASDCYWATPKLNTREMTLQNGLRLVNGVLTIQSDSLTTKLKIGDGMYFYQSEYGDLIGNIKTNIAKV